MAPEVCKDKPFDARADIWSLGCLVYEMCWLRPAFPVGSGRIEADLRTVISLQVRSAAGVCGVERVVGWRCGLCL